MNHRPPEPPEPPEPPIPPPPPPPDDDPDSNISMEEGEDLVNYKGRGEEKKKYKKYYRLGKYRTVVIVFEGSVVLAPYDEAGPKYEEGVTLTEGDKTSVEGDIDEEDEKTQIQPLHTS